MKYYSYYIAMQRREPFITYVSILTCKDKIWLNMHFGHFVLLLCIQRKYDKVKVFLRHSRFYIVDKTTTHVTSVHLALFLSRLVEGTTNRPKHHSLNVQYCLLINRNKTTSCVISSNVTLCSHHTSKVTRPTHEANGYYSGYKGSEPMHFCD